MSKAELLHGKKSTREYRIFQSWMDRAATIAFDFAEEYEDDPFAYNETASVSLLCSAAIAQGYLALAEFIQLKRARHDKRKKASGRWDLWFAAEGRQWGMEFKQIKSRFTAGRIASAMKEAVDCAKDIVKKDTDQRMGCLIASDTPLVDRARENLVLFSKHCDFARKIDIEGDSRETYIFLDYVK